MGLRTQSTLNLLRHLTVKAVIFILWQQAWLPKHEIRALWKKNAHNIAECVLRSVLSSFQKNILWIYLHENLIFCLQTTRYTTQRRTIVWNYISGFYFATRVISAIKCFFLLTKCIGKLWSKPFDLSRKACKKRFQIIYKGKNISFRTDELLLYLVRFIFKPLTISSCFICHQV